LTPKKDILSDPRNSDDALLPGVDHDRLFSGAPSAQAPRILILYGSLRTRSFSRFAAQEAGRILTRLWAEVRFFNPSGLPLVDDGVDASHPRVRELRHLTAWCERMVCSRPELHRAMPWASMRRA
jgi:arsenic resistance protein ArsH